MSEHHDAPLNISHVNDLLADALLILAGRVIHHLDGDWNIERSSGGAILVGPDEERVLFSLYGIDYDPHKFYIRTFTPTGRPTVKGDWLNIFMLPAQIAAHLEADTLPKARKRLASARKQQALREATSDRRKQRIEAIAKALDWNSSSYKAHSRDPYASLPRQIGRRRDRNAAPPNLHGYVDYADDGTMNAHLAGLPEVLLDQIVDLVAAHYKPRRARWPRTAPRPAPLTKRAEHTGTDK